MDSINRFYFLQEVQTDFVYVVHMQLKTSFMKYIIHIYGKWTSYGTANEVPAIHNSYEHQ